MSAIDKITGAIAVNDWEKFHAAVINTKNLNDTDTHGRTSLTLAAYYGRTRMAKELIRRGALINYADKYGSTPVYWAAKWGHTDLIRVFVEMKADANKPNKRGVTPLHISAFNGYMATVKYLVEECHTEINTTTDFDTTPISDAKRRGHKDVADYLEQQLVVRQQTAKAQAKAQVRVS